MQTKESKEKKKYSFETLESYGPDDTHCHYSGLPSPSAYALDPPDQYGKDPVDYDGIGDQGRTIKVEQQSNIVMEKIQKYYPIGLAFISFIFSVTLWFSGYKDEGVFVGVWVPSILSLGNFMNSINKKWTY